MNSDLARAEDIAAAMPRDYLADVHVGPYVRTVCADCRHVFMGRTYRSLCALCVHKIPPYLYTPTGTCTEISGNRT